MYPLPTGLQAWIDDVVVDSGVRGRGVGEALNHAALEEARTGAPRRSIRRRGRIEAANRLYQRLGFVARETNVYRYRL